MKKIFIVSTLFVSSFFSIAGAVDIDDNFPYDGGNENSIKEAVQHTNTDIVSPTVGEENIQDKSPFIYYVSKVINYFLTLLAFFSALVIIYGFSLVYTDKTDAGVKKGYKYIKMASIALIVIGISWLFSMWIFGIYSGRVANV